MVRTLIGGLVAGLIIFVLGYVFWATPLGEIPFRTAGDVQNAAVQASLAQNLTQTGTGAYTIPAHGSAQGAVLYGRGPIATVYFNTSGYSPDDMSMILPGFVVALVGGLLIAFGLELARSVFRILAWYWITREAQAAGPAGADQVLVKLTILHWINAGLVEGDTLSSNRGSQCYLLREIVKTQAGPPLAKAASRQTSILVDFVRTAGDRDFLVAESKSLSGARGEQWNRLKGLAG